MTVFVKGEKKQSVKNELSVNQDRIRIETDDGLEIIDIDFEGLDKTEENRIRASLASKQFSEKS